MNVLSMNKSLQQNLPWKLYGETTTFIETKQKEVPSLKLTVRTWKMDGWNTGFGKCYMGL